MKIYNNKLWLSDIDQGLSVISDLTELVGSKIMITGCTGLICSALVDVLARWNITHREKIGIVAAGRNLEKINNRFFYISKEKWFESKLYEATSSENRFDFSCDYIVHGAGNASPNKVVAEPVETMLSNFWGVYQLLDYARHNKVKRLLYISSSEIYGSFDREEPFQINDYGYIDLLNPRNSYAVGKRAAETLCVSFAKEWNVDSILVRPGHIYGPTALESDNRVSSMWAYAAAKGRDIVMMSDGSQIRSYCYAIDCATAIIKVLLKGKSMHAYNISNPNSIITIREMAELLAKVSGSSVKYKKPSDMVKKGFNPMKNSSLDSTELIALGWEGLFDPESGFLHTVKILQDVVYE